MRADYISTGDNVNELIRNFTRLKGTQAEANLCTCRIRRQPFEKFDKMYRGTEIEPIGAKMNAGQHNLLIACLNKIPEPAENLFNGTASAWTADRGNYAV